MGQRIKKKDTGEKRKRHWLVAILLVVLLLAGGIGGQLLAKYVTENRQRAEMISAGFHISSDYLKEPSANAAYTIGDTGSLVLHLYNYEVENTAQRSQVAMTYTVSVTTTGGASGGSCTVTHNGSQLTETNGAFTYELSGENEEHVLTITPSATPVTVTVTTTSPYSKTLTATFTRDVNAAPTFTFTDQHDGTGLLRIKTNGYGGSVTVSWDEAKYSPDNTNHLMAGWQDATHSYTLTDLAANSVYDLLFFHTNGTLTEITNGAGTTIHLN